MEKTIIIINGAGGVGKDTICNMVSHHYKVIMVSSIDPIKEIAAYGGWDYTDKSHAGRKLLSDLKAAFISYNDLPTQYLIKTYENFLIDSNEILFVQIREPAEIIKFKKLVNIRCISVLIKAKRVSDKFGNSSDDRVEDYQYDYVYNNDKPLSELERNFMEFFLSIIT